MLILRINVFHLNSARFLKCVWPFWDTIQYKIRNVIPIFRYDIPANCSKFTRKKPTPKCDFKLRNNFIEIILRLGFSPVNLLHIFRTPFTMNTYGWLLQRLPGHTRITLSSLNFFGFKPRKLMKGYEQ